MEQSCGTCVSRLICPIHRQVCNGWNDAAVFWSFLDLIAPAMNWNGVRGYTEGLRAAHDNPELLKEGE